MKTKTWNDAFFVCSVLTSKNFQNFAKKDDTMCFLSQQTGNDEKNVVVQNNVNILFSRDYKNVTNHQ